MFRAATAAAVHANAVVKATRRRETHVGGVGLATVARCLPESHAAVDAARVVRPRANRLQPTSPRRDVYGIHAPYVGHGVDVRQARRGV
ncbi:hypothetical protein Tneu_0892 [Pyrobaculum neutrophilum V24Sta]|uniref:Uncharacterized protein n=1 Tax=Pyrobaculum neutrophilum (strain DSM 2338 / JCM 9278 / NBRC 100436 / V24Sta) TaxID=444157 RepID=B1YDG6_PYRNV|nr:hypothetical protein Tneu_0892 [Pyrobaculum neutrophilum V24Sta]